MELEYVLPADIERRSFEIIAAEMGDIPIPGILRKPDHIADLLRDKARHRQ